MRPWSGGSCGSPTSSAARRPGSLVDADGCSTKSHHVWIVFWWCVTVFDLFMNSLWMVYCGFGRFVMVFDLFMNSLWMVYCGFWCFLMLFHLFMNSSWMICDGC